MHPEPYEQASKYEDWDNPYYMAGYVSGSSSTRTDEELTQAQQQIKLLEGVAKIDKTTIESLNNHINKLESIIDELNQPWYIKLWNSIPRFSLSIRRIN